MCDTAGPPAGPRQAALFTGARSVTEQTIAGAGHAITLQRSHDNFQRTVDRWLNGHVENRRRRRRPLTPSVDAALPNPESAGRRWSSTMLSAAKSQGVSGSTRGLGPTKSD